MNGALESQRLGVIQSLLALAEECCKWYNARHYHTLSWCIATAELPWALGLCWPSELCWPSSASAGIWGDMKRWKGDRREEFPWCWECRHWAGLWTCGQCVGGTHTQFLAKIKLTFFVFKRNILIASFADYETLLGRITKLQR